jgi:Papain family cysteine protease
MSLKLFFCLLSSLALSLAAVAQKRSTGLILDAANYARCPKMPDFDGAKFNSLPLSISLRPYCPTPSEQGLKPTCVGWAVGYGGLTISRAIRLGLTQRKAIDSIAHSAYYIYNNLKKPDGCGTGVPLPAALDFLKKNGDCRAATFSNDSINCDIPTNPRAYTEAMQFRIKDFARLFDADASIETKILKLRMALKDSCPVIIGFYLTNSFFNINDGDKKWSPKPEEQNMSAHAAVVVGYNAQSETFELMNSWGNQWGDGGFIRVGFEDLARRISYAFQFIPDDNWQTKTVKTVERPVKPQDYSIQLSGAFQLRAFENGQKADVKVAFNRKRGIYEATRKNWKVGRSTFQLVVKEVPRGKYVYVFSQDAARKIEKHYPLSTNDFVNFMPSAEAEIILPSATDGMIKTTVGEDLLVILYADQAIEDFDIRLKKMETEQGGFAEKFKKSFGDLLIFDVNIRFNDAQMQFLAHSRAGEGTVVPIILGIEGK